MQVWNSTESGSGADDNLTEGIGLKGVRERLESVRGSLVVGPVADGFQFVVRIPSEELENEVD